MNIGVAFDEGQIAANLGSCKQVLVVTTEGREPVSKHMAEVRGTSTTDLIKLASMEQIDVDLRLARPRHPQRARDDRCCSCPAAKARPRRR